MLWGRQSRRSNQGCYGGKIQDGRQSIYDFDITKSHRMLTDTTSYGFLTSRNPNLNKKIQQTKALGMHLPLAHLISMSDVVRHILPTSKFQPSNSRITLFSTDISGQHVWELWVWIQFTGLTLHLLGTPVNNPITLTDSICVALQISEQLFTVSFMIFQKDIFLLTILLDVEDTLINCIKKGYRQKQYLNV